MPARLRWCTWHQEVADCYNFRYLGSWLFLHQSNQGSPKVLQLRHWAADDVGRTKGLATANFTTKPPMLRGFIDEIEGSSIYHVSNIFKRVQKLVWKSCWHWCREMWQTHLENTNPGKKHLRKRGKTRIRLRRRLCSLRLELGMLQHPVMVQ